MSDKQHPNGYRLKESVIIILLGALVFLLISVFSVQRYLPILRHADSREQLPPREIISSSLPVDLLWQIEIDEAVSSAPMLTENTVVVSTELALYGLDSTTGRPRWKHASGPHPSPPPIVANGEKVIYGERNNIFALDIETGEVIWQHRMKSDDVKSIVTNQSVVYVAAQPTQIEALELETGKLIWSLNGYEQGIETRGPILFLQGEELYLFTTEIHILDTQTGSIKKVIRQNLIPISQLVGDRFYSAQWVRQAKTLDLIAELESPSHKVLIDACESFKPPFVFSENRFFAVGKCGGVYSLDAQNYYIRWRYQEDIIAESPVAIYQNRLYALFDNGDIHAIDLQKGQQLGMLKTDRELPGSVRNANFSSRGVVANEEILIVTFNDTSIWAFCQLPCFEENMQDE